MTRTVVCRTASLSLLILLAVSSAHAADTASGYFRMDKAKLEVKHALAVVEDESDRDAPHTLVFLSAVPLDARKVAAAFDAMDAVRELEPAGGFVRICLDAQGGECGMFFSPEGFNTGGYGELKLDDAGANRIKGAWTLAKPDTFFEQEYQYDLHFDAAITAAPGTDLPAGGGEPGKAYNAYLGVLAKGDIAALRTLSGEEGQWRFPVDDDTQSKESLKSLRDGQPLHAEISRGRVDGDHAVLWVEGVDRDEIRRAGRVRMEKVGKSWTFKDADLDSVEE
ncbi:hypothetical protein [Lysobacter fragariae]